MATGGFGMIAVIALLAAVVLGGVYLLTRLLQESQAGDSTQRGRDSAEPGGHYTDGPD